MAFLPTCQGRWAMIEAIVNLAVFAISIPAYLRRCTFWKYTPTEKIYLNSTTRLSGAATHQQPLQ